MRTRTCKSRLKPVALLGAAALGLTAFGDYYEWTATEKAYWEDDTSWTVKTADFTDYRAGNTGSEIAFKTAATADDTYGVVIYNNTYSFSADGATYGLTKENAGMYVSTWWNNGAVTLNVASGTYGFSEVAVNEAGANNSGTTAALNLNGGSLSAGAVRVATGGTLTMNGGTLATTSVTGAGTLAIGANGGTFANKDSATIATALTGSGTLTKTGAGALDITGNVSNFKGKIVVDKDATGYVTIGAETIYPGETKDFDPQPTYTAWTEDFETSSALSGWIYSGDSRRSSTISERTLSDGSTSKFYRLYLGKGGGTTGISATADYALNLVKSDVYAFEFDLFPKCSWGKENTLTITGKKVVEEEGTPSEETVTLATFTTNESNQGNGGDKTKVRVAVGETTTELPTKLPIESRGTDVATAAENSTLWYHVIIFGNKDLNKTYLRVLDYNNNEVISQEIGDFATVSALSVIIRTNGSGAAVLGLDNLAYKTLEPAGIPADPIMVVEPESYAGNRTVTITCEDEDAKIYWRSDADSDFAEYTQTITVSESTTIYAYAQNDAGKSVNTVAVRVYANVKLNAPSVARRGWYRLQITAGDAPIAGEEPQYVFSYVMNGCGTTPKTTETGDSALVRASSGNNFNVNGTWAQVWATADGFKNSDTVNYAGYTFDPTKFNELYNMDWIDESINQPRSSVWPDETLIEVDGVNYRSFGTGAKSYANDYFFVSSDNDSGGSSRWDIYRSNKSSNGLRYNGATTVGNGRVLFKGVKPGTLIYLNSDELTDPVNMTLVSEGYTNADEYVYEVTGEGETVNATIKIGVNYGRIYCVKIYEPIPEETDTFAADEATLVDGAFTVPEGTTKITLGGADVTKGFYIEGTTATLLSPWFAWNGAEFGEGMVVGEETVRLDIDLVEGLYYGPAAATTLEGLARPATLTMYDGTNAAALTTVAKPEGGTAFFTVFVDVKAK